MRGGVSRNRKRRRDAIAQTAEIIRLLVSSRPEPHFADDENFSTSDAENALKQLTSWLVRNGSDIKNVARWMSESRDRRHPAVHHATHKVSREIGRECLDAVPVI